MSNYIKICSVFHTMPKAILQLSQEWTRKIAMCYLYLDKQYQTLSLEEHTEYNTFFFLDNFASTKFLENRIVTHETGKLWKNMVLKMHDIIAHFKNKKEYSHSTCLTEHFYIVVFTWYGHCRFRWIVWFLDYSLIYLLGCSILLDYWFLCLFFLLLTSPLDAAKLDL